MSQTLRYLGVALQEPICRGFINFSAKVPCRVTTKPCKLHPSRRYQYCFARQRAAEIAGNSILLGSRILILILIVGPALPPLPHSEPTGCTVPTECSQTHNYP